METTMVEGLSWGSYGGGGAGGNGSIPLFFTTTGTLTTTSDGVSGGISNTTFTAPNTVGYPYIYPNDQPNGMFPNPFQPVIYPYPFPDPDSEVILLPRDVISRKMALEAMLKALEDQVFEQSKKGYRRIIMEENE